MFRKSCKKSKLWWLWEEERRGDIAKRETIKVSPESSIGGCEGNKKDKDNSRNREDGGKGHSPVVLLVFTQIMDDPRKSMNTLFMWVRYHVKTWFQTIWYYVKCKYYFNYKLFCHVTSFCWDDNAFIISVLDFRYFPECCWTGWLGKRRKQLQYYLKINPMELMLTQMLC